MSKFKIGDEVMLSPKSRWVSGHSTNVDSSNPLNVKGVITSVNDYGVIEYDITWSNGISNSCYRDEDLNPLYKQQPQHESPYAVIEELQAHVETLEEALEKVTKELIELREGNASVNTEETFKPIADMTMEDWVSAERCKWVFVQRDGMFVEVDCVDEYTEGRYPVSTKYASLTLNGTEYYAGQSNYDIIKRIR